MPEIIVTLGDNTVSKFVFDKDVVSIGRSRDNDICIENLAVSRNHARIRRENGSFFLSDLNSANGTFVNGVQITKTELFNDDVITIGKHKLIFKNVEMSDEAMISDAFGAERTMLVDKAPEAFLVVTRGKQKDAQFRLEKAETTIGRGNDCDVVLHDWFVSKQHAVVHRHGETYLLRDAGSWRGTKVNEIQVTETVLKDGDEIQLGGTRLVFRLATEEAPKPTGRVPRELAAPEPVEPPTAEQPAEEEVEPIRAGGEEDFIEPSAREPVEMISSEETAKSVPLEGALAEGVEMIEAALREAASTAEKAEPEQAAVEAEPAAEKPAEAEAEKPQPEEGEKPSDNLAAQIRLWEEALKNKSPAIRRQAAKMLKKLTGRDYDY